MNANADDQTGGPEPLEEEPSFFWRIPWEEGAVLLAAGGVFLCMMAAAPSPSRGATHSAKLQWEERNREIQKTIETHDPAPARPVPTQ